jgi:CDP-glucose 4,6-dehydratase
MEKVVKLGEHFSGKRVLVTGHTGFKGAWLVAWLRRMNAIVTGFALPAEEPSLFRSAALHEGITHVEADIRDLAAFRKCVEQAKPDIVLHLAAQSLVRLSYDEPVGTFATNVMGTVNVLEACRGSSAKAIVVVTTDKCYANKEWPWAYREIDELGGHDPYSASKACAELVTSAYRDSFHANGGARVASARAGNVIGGGDWAKDRIIPDIVRAANAKTRAVIRNPMSVRPWQHVLEPLAGYLLLGARLLRGDAGMTGAWNFGPRDDEAVPVGSLARRFVSRLGLGVEESLDLRASDPNAPTETKLLRVDSMKARSDLGWRPVLSVDEAVDMTAEWYRAFLADASSARKTLDEQIASYDERLHAR